MTLIAHNGFELREARDDELLQLGAIGAYVYGGSFGDSPDNVIASSNRPDWTLCAFEGSKMVASTSAFPFRMRANGNAVPMAGVTAVGTLPEYRRRGLVRGLLTAALARMRDRQQPVSGLWASQGAIYQRFGYAASSTNRQYRIDTVDVRFADGNPGYANVARVDPDDEFDLLRTIYADFVERRTGYLQRSRPLWYNNSLSLDEPDGPVHAAICRDPQGQARGYVLYTLRANKVDHLARAQEMVIRDLAWLDGDAVRGLWSFLASHDLVGRIRWDKAPVDDPMPELLLEPRLLHVTEREGHWLRIVDIPAALEARGYGSTRIDNPSINIGIAPDPEAPWNEGTWNLQVEAGQAVVKAATNADITVTAKSLSSLYSGYRSARWLANAGLLDGDDASVAKADSLFATRHAPHTPDHY